jgi:exopolysaccharide production protein ExoZ
VRKTGYYHGLDVLRIVASIAVVYVHTRDWFATGGQRWRFDEGFTAAVLTPLHVDAYLVPLGICTFFLISGLVITHSAFRESPGRFLFRRAARTLPAMWVVLLVVWIVARAGVPIGVTGEVTVRTLVTNMTLTNFFFSGNPGLDLVTWTLVVQFAFYLLVAAMIPLLRRWPWLPPALSVALVSVLLSVVRTESPLAMHTLRVVVSLLPVLFIGQLIGLVRLGKLHPLAGLAYGALHWLLLVRGDLTSDFTPAIPGYPQLTACLALLVIVCCRLPGGMTFARWLRTAANRTYAVFLVHVPVLYVTPHLVSAPAGSTLAFLVAMAGTVITAELLYRFVEEPVVRWCRTRERTAVTPSPDDARTEASPIHPIG